MAVMRSGGVEVEQRLLMKAVSGANGRARQRRYAWRWTDESTTTRGAGRSCVVEERIVAELHDSFTGRKKIRERTTTYSLRFKI
jgi:hypothetical protein